jgi:uncharacterized protein YcfL
MNYYPLRVEFSELFGKRRATLLFLVWLVAAGCVSSSNQNEPASLATPLSAPPPDQIAPSPVVQQTSAPAPSQQLITPAPVQPPASRPVEAAGATAPPVDGRTVFAAALKQALHASKVQFTKGPEGYLKIQVDVENRSDSSQAFRYGIEWLNANGEVLPFANNGFLDWTLRAHETSTIAATAPTAAAKDFRVVFMAPVK